ncbi:hypothetical protein [Pontibacter sp. BAB1700]|nr:hypothetical protein [Pontibacter sp. BAB1700]
MDCQLVYDQPAGREEYDSNVMLLSPAHTNRQAPAHIDLQGLPW